MNLKINKRISLFFVCALCACAPYVSPERATWRTYLNGASFTDMTEMSRVAKRPVYLGAGGRTVSSVVDVSDALEYGDKATNDTMVAREYMSKLEYELYDTLRTPGVSVQRAGTDVVIILVRDAIMELNVGEISVVGDKTLTAIANILRRYDATFIEIAGYTDAMRDANAANALSMDMAQRVGVHLSRHGINTVRMFIVARGSARPIAGQDGVGRLTNRRLELRIAPAR
jgi:outer membrane protein OmpA-like peptidoglycan-associated protein